jgi:hypothetical protein
MGDTGLENTKQGERDQMMTISKLNMINNILYLRQGSGVNPVSML